MSYPEGVFHASPGRCPWLACVIPLGSALLPMCTFPVLGTLGL